MLKYNDGSSGLMQISKNIMPTLSIKKIPKGKLNPILKGLPEKLKDPACYEAIEKRLFLSVYSDHKHKSLKPYKQCNMCMLKLQRKRELIKEYGFKSFEQYLEWRKIMDIIYNRKQISI